MAISTPVSLASAFQTSAANDSPAIASMTFTAGKLYLFTFEIDRATPPDLSTGYSFTHGATDRTASWHFIRTQLFGTPRAIAVYWYIPSVTETVTLTYNAPGTGANSYGYSLVEIASGFDGTTPILQSNGANGTSVASVSVTLGSAPTTGNLLMSFVGSRAASGVVTPRTNWTELSEVDGSGTTGNSGCIEVQYVFDPNLETTASASAAGNRTWGIIALEVAAATGSSVTVTPGVGALTITGFAPSIGLPQTVLPGVGSLVITGFAPSIGLPQTVLPGLGQLTITGFAPLLGLPRTVLPGVGSLVITGFAPVVSAGPTVQPGAGSLVITGFAPSVGLPRTVLPGLGALTITGFAPTVGVPRTVLPGLGELVITGFAPAIALPVTVRPGVGALVITGFAPIVSSGPTVQVGLGELVITGFAPTVEAIADAVVTEIRRGARRKNRRRQDRVHLENLRRQLEESLEEITAEVAEEMAVEDAVRAEEIAQADDDASDLFVPQPVRPPRPRRPPPIDLARFTAVVFRPALPKSIDLRALRMVEEDEEERFLALLEML